MIRRFGIPLVMGLALSACAGDALPPLPPEPARQGYDLLDRRIVVLGAGVPHGGGIQRLRSWIADSGPVTHHLLVTERYQATGWRYYEAAATADGTPLQARSTDRLVGACASVSWAGCAHAEDLVVLLPDELLRAGSADGLAIEILAREGLDSTVRLTAQQIRDHLQMVAAARK